MKRALIAATGTALLLTPLGVAYAQDADAPLTVAIDTSKCGQATITYTSTNTLPYSGDYRVDDEAGEPDDVPADLLVKEGPLAGTLFGLRFNPTPIPAESVVPVVVDFDEDQGDGEVSLSAWVNRGPEQRAFAAVVTAKVDTDCADPVETTPPAVPDDETPADEFNCDDFPLADGRTAQDVLDADPSDPNVLDLDEDGDACDDDEDRPTLPDEAPAPTIIDADLPVTG